MNVSFAQTLSEELQMIHFSRTYPSGLDPLRSPNQVRIMQVWGDAMLLGKFLRRIYVRMAPTPNSLNRTQKKITIPALVFFSLLFGIPCFFLLQGIPKSFFECFFPSFPVILGGSSGKKILVFSVVSPVLFFRKSKEKKIRVKEVFWGEFLVFFLVFFKEFGVGAKIGGNF